MTITEAEDMVNRWIYTQITRVSRRKMSSI